MPIQIKDKIKEISPYVAGKSKAADSKRTVKLSSNENALGTSPRVYEALKILPDLHRYPDSANSSLLTAVSNLYNLPEENFVFGAGSDEILSLICQSILTPEDETIYCEHGFAMYPIYTKVAGAYPIQVKEKNYTICIENIIKAVNKKTKIIFIANPNNPTGTFIKQEDIKKTLDSIPNNILLVVDEAYYEFAKDYKNYQSAYDLVPKYDNLIVTRTLSKAYGLASMRIGYGYSNKEYIQKLNTIRGPFNVTLPAQITGSAALKDQDFIVKSIQHNDKWLKKYEETFRDKIVTKSIANFVLLDCGNRCDEVYSKLMQEGFIARQVKNYGIKNAIRITIGTDEENEEIFKILLEIL